MKYAFVNGILIDVTQDAAPLKDKVVLVKDGRIEAVTDRTADLKGYELIDLEGGFLLPGLINLHVHLATSGKPPREKKKPTNYKRLYQLLTGSRAVRADVKKMLAGYA